MTQDESSYVVDAEYGVGGKNKVTHVTWFSFGTIQFWKEIFRGEHLQILPLQSVSGHARVDSIAKVFTGRLTTTATYNQVGS